MSTVTLTDLPQESQHSFAEELIQKYELTEENENLANTTMLALIAQANLSDQQDQKEYVERLNGFFDKYQALVQELRRYAGE